MQRGIVDLPLHYGNVPTCLFERMMRLILAITELVISEFGVQELLRRFSDPIWFQSLGCIAGFDWHSSGLTTVVCGALKDGVRGKETDLGFFVCGGKGRASRQTPDEIRLFAEKFGLDGNHLVQISRLVAKVDSAAVQDGYQIYHHIFIGSRCGEWVVVQQGMNTVSRWARRYHWFSVGLNSFVTEPHKGIVGEPSSSVLNMVAHEAERARQAATVIATQHPEATIREFVKIKLPSHHHLCPGDIRPEYLRKILLSTYENPPTDFADLLLTSGVGPKTLRALVLLAEVIYGAPPSFRDPLTYSFAHGGKDGYPYPIKLEDYDRSLFFLEKGIKEARIGRGEKLMALRRLERWAKGLVSIL